MKVLTLAFMLAAFCTLSSESKKCFSRKEKHALRKMMMEMNCADPMPQLVPLPVPDGYDYVVPSMSKVDRCSNLLCWGKNKGCRPTDTRKVPVKVEAKMADGSGMTCMDVLVDEHISCGCECMTTEDECTKLQTFNPSMCSCDCREDAEDICENQGEEGDWMFYDSNCSCVCSNDKGC